MNLNVSSKYQYMIFRLYKWAKNVDSTPEFTVTATLSIVHFFQSLTLLVIVKELFEPEFIGYVTSLHKFHLSFVLALWVLGHFLWLRRFDFAYLNSRYSKETKNEKLRNGLIIFLYLTGSIVLFFVLLILFGHGGR